MTVVLNTIGIVFITHLAVFLFMVNFRPKKILKFCKALAQSGRLTGHDYDVLEARYKGYLGFLEGFPHEGDYPAIYQDNEFHRYRNRSRAMMKYLAITLAISTVILIAIVLTNPDSFNK